MRVELKIALISLAVIGWAASCGGRSGIELGDVEDLLDASLPPNAGGSGGGIVDGSIKKDVQQDTSAADGDATTPPKDVNVKDQKDFFDSLPFPWPDSGPLGECAQCLSGQCGDAVNACYNDPSCWGGIQCAIPGCFLGGGGGSAGSGGGGGGINFACLMECFDNKMTSLMEALTMFQCITGTCGPACGLGGFAGAGGGQGQNFTFYADPSASFAPSGARYIGQIRVPEPEEVSFMYPWLADVLEGKTPDPLPPSARKR